MGFVLGTFLGSAVFLALAICQWRNRGRWGLGIGILASILLVGQSLFFYIAANSPRVRLTSGMVATFLLTLFAFGALAVVNFWLYLDRKRQLR